LAIGSWLLAVGFWLLVGMGFGEFEKSSCNIISLLNLH